MTPAVAKAVKSMIEKIWDACSACAPQSYKDSQEAAKNLFEQMFGTSMPPTSEGGNSV